MPKSVKGVGRYEAIIASIFEQRYKKGALEFEFHRTDIEKQRRRFRLNYLKI